MGSEMCIRDSLIQSENTFFGLTGPNVVREALGEDITADELGGPKVHSKSGVVDLTAPDELGALRTALRLLSYLPDNNHSPAPFKSTSLSLEDYVEEEAVLLLCNRLPHCIVSNPQLPPQLL